MNYICGACGAENCYDYSVKLNTNRKYYHCNNLKCREKVIREMFKFSYLKVASINENIFEIRTVKNNMFTKKIGVTVANSYMPIKQGE